MAHRGVALAVTLALLVGTLSATLAQPSSRPIGALSASFQVAPSAASRQVVIFVPGINTKYELVSPVPQTQGVAGFSTIKTKLVKKYRYNPEDFIDFGYDASAYLDGDIDLLPYTCQQSGQDIGLSGASLRQLIKNVHSLRPNDKIVLVGHSLGGAVIIWALDGLRDPGVEAAIGGVVTIDSPLYGARSDDVARLYAAPAEFTQCYELFRGSVLVDSEAALALARDLDGYLQDGDRSAASVRLDGALRRLHDQGTRIGTFGNLYDCVFNHVACGTLGTSLLASLLGGSGGLGKEDYSWTQVYPRGSTPLGQSEMYEFPDYWPGCLRIDVCVVESHGYLLEHPQPQMLAAIGRQAQTATEPVALTLDAAEVARRALEAIQLAGTFRYQDFDFDDGRSLVGIGEVNLRQGRTWASEDPENPGVYYCVGSQMYVGSLGGSWSVHEAELSCEHVLVRTLREMQDPSGGWTLQGTEVVDGNEAYLLAGVSPDDESEDATLFQTIWVDAATFLPLRFIDGDRTCDPLSPDISRPFTRISARRSTLSCRQRCYKCSRPRRPPRLPAPRCPPRSRPWTGTRSSPRSRRSRSPTASCRSGSPRLRSRRRRQTS